MRILTVAGSLYNDDIPEFRKNKNGLAFMIKDIVEYGSMYNEMYFLSK